MDSNRLILNMLKDPAYNDYDTFASNGMSQPVPSKATASEKWAVPRASGSLEAIHGMYHVVVGGSSVPGAKAAGGHMSRVPTAAFDPIFWMHHCQIDRIFALWQSIHQDKPNSWFSDPNEAERDLIPFRKAQGDTVFWKSNHCQTTEVFGYRYEDVKGTGAATKAAVDSMYKWSVPDRNSHDTHPAPANMEPIDVTTTQFFNFAGKEDAVKPILSESLTIAQQPLLLKRQALLREKPEPLPAHTTVHFRDWYIDDEVQR